MGTKKKTSSLVPLNRRAAGIDIGATFHVAAVPAELDAEPVRSFRSFTADLNALADWLVRVGITTVAMESTGIYWIPVFEILEARGLEVALVNARDAKNVPGRKTDINDAQWIQQLHAYGSLRASFRPGAEIVAPCVPPASRAAARICGVPRPAHAEGADADEPAATSRRRRHHGRDGHEDPPLHR